MPARSWAGRSSTRRAATRFRRTSIRSTRQCPGQDRADVDARARERLVRRRPEECASLARDLLPLARCGVRVLCAACVCRHARAATRIADLILLWRAKRHGLPAPFSGFFPALACNLLSVAVCRKSLPMPRPESAGLSAARLQRLDRFLQEKYLETGRLPCAYTLIQRRGQIAHSSALGYMDVERKRALTEDAIFRIYSMTKPLTSVAMMMLVEEGLVA